MEAQPKEVLSLQMGRFQDNKITNYGNINTAALAYVKFDRCCFDCTHVSQLTKPPPLDISLANSCYTKN